jgi:regulator of protease activity HflC (stomatin/prohibitin superfamily)
VDFTFFLIEDEIGDIHREIASNYRPVIVSRAKDAIKNEAIFVTFTEFFQSRKQIEECFRNAVQARWNQAPSLHCILDQFHLGRIRIPDSVATKQLESRLQNERNDREQFLQQAQLERELTEVEVNVINLERQKVLRTAEAQGSLLRSKARSEAERIKVQAQINGTALLLKSASILTQDHITAFSYIRTLGNRDMVDVDVSYLSSDNVLRTATV